MNDVTTGTMKDKVVLVTGGSRGIGEASAILMSKAGARVAVLGRKIETLEEVASKIKDQGGDALAVQTHVGKQDQVESAVDRVVKTFGRIDVLVNNAATNPHFGPMLDCTPELWDKIFGVNLKGAFMMTRACAPYLEESNGVVVNVASVAGLKPMPLMGVYAVTKAGLIHMTKILAKELGPRGIRVNCVAPGVIKTKFSRALWDTPEILDEVMKTHAIPRIGEPMDVAEAILFLACDKSSYATGSTFVLDGGELL